MMVKDLYQDCLQYEESTLAHYIYHLLAEGKVFLTDELIENRSESGRPSESGGIDSEKCIRNSSC
jgi:hypothetical protein